MDEKRNIFDLPHNDLVLLMREMGQAAYRARQILNWLYQSRVTSFQQMTNIPAKFQDQLGRVFTIEVPHIEQELISKDGSRKYLLSLVDGEKIEAVLIPAEERHTLCVSSQVGCKFSCAFCRTGTMGYIRNLAPGEMTGQLLAVEKTASKKIDNIVFMGMGEPLDNCDNLLKALANFTHPEALAMSPSRITVSTAGIPDKMRALKKAFPKIGIAISLNSAEHDTRYALMPIEIVHPISEILSAVRDINPGPQTPITFEYILLEGRNDSLRDAESLAGLLKGYENVKVNLISFNPSEGIEFKPSSRDVAEKFQSVLKNTGIECFIRKSAGADIAAACGQLAC